MLYTIKQFEGARERSPFAIVKTWYKYVYLKFKLLLKITSSSLRKTNVQGSTTIPNNNNSPMQDYVFELRRRIW